MLSTSGRVRPPRPGLTRPIPLFKVIIPALLIATGSAQTTQANPNNRIKTLATAGDWRVIQHTDPFATPQASCSVRSTGFNAASARRERPRLRVSLERRSFVIDPSFKLTHTIGALRDILEQRRSGRSGRKMEQFKPDNRLVYKLRVDDGEVIVNQDQTPTFEPWRLRLDAARFASLIAAMSNGKTLHIGWTIDRAGEHFAYNLKDFGQIATVSQDSCPASGTPQPTPTGE